MCESRSSSMWVSWCARINGDEHISEMSVWCVSVETIDELFDELLLWLWLECTEICCWSPFDGFSLSVSSPVWWFSFSMYSSYFSSDWSFDKRFCSNCETSERRLGLIWIEICVMSRSWVIKRSSRKSYGNVSTHSASSWIKNWVKRPNFGLLCASFCCWRGNFVLNNSSSNDYCATTHLNEWLQVLLLLRHIPDLRQQLIWLHEEPRAEQKRKDIRAVRVVVIGGHHVLYQCLQRSRQQISIAVD